MSKTIGVDAEGVLATVSETLPNNPNGSPAARAWSFTDPLQAKRHQPMFDADLSVAQRAKLVAVPDVPPPGR